MAGIESFKNSGKDCNELLLHTTDAVGGLSLDHQKEELSMSKRRNIGTNNEAGTTTLAFIPPSDPESMGQILDMMNSNDLMSNLSGAQMARKILSRQRYPPIDVIISAGIVAHCIAFLRSSDLPELQYEAACVITDIAWGSSAQTEFVFNAGAVEPLLELLDSPHSHLVEQAIWALGNIAGDGPRLRDMVISKGILPPLVELVKSRIEPALLRRAAWTISNLCRYKNPSPSPPYEVARRLLPALHRLIQLDDIEVVTDACWALSYLGDKGTNDQIGEIVASGVVPRLVELLACGNFDTITPALRAVGNCVTGSDAQTQVIVEANVLPCLHKLLTCSKPNIVKEAAWTISNIAAGTIAQIQAIINTDIVPLLIDIINHGEFPSQKEACTALVNVTHYGTIEHIIYLCDKGAIEALCHMLLVKDWRTLVLAMDGLEDILKMARSVEQDSKVTSRIECCGGLDNIERLQGHDINTVYDKAYNLIENYFE